MRISDWSSDVCSSDLLRLPQARRKNVFINQFFHLPLTPFMNLRCNMAFFQKYQPHISVLATRSSSTESRRFSNSILWISILTGHTSVHLPHRLEALLRCLNSFMPRRCGVMMEPIGPL